MTRTTPPSPVDIAALIPELMPLARPVVRLHPRPGSADPRTSSVGGPFLWPADEPWPMCPTTEHHVSLWRNNNDPRPLKAGDNEFPLAGILQLFAADVPELPFPANTDLLQVLWCPFQETHYPVEPVLMWRDSTQITETLDVFPTPHPLADDEVLPRCCVLDPERLVEYPNSDVPGDLIPQVRAATDQIKAETGWWFHYHLSSAPGLKVGGYPGWTQEPCWPDCSGCGRTMDHLLTIPSDECDGESWRRWIPLEDRAAGDIGSTRTDAEPEAHEAIWHPTDMTFGDMGGVYLFVCTSCPDMPYTHHFDCP